MKKIHTKAYKRERKLPLLYSKLYLSLNARSTGLSKRVEFADLRFVLGTLFHIPRKQWTEILDELENRYYLIRRRGNSHIELLVLWHPCGFCSAAFESAAKLHRHIQRMHRKERELEK